MIRIGLVVLCLVGASILAPVARADSFGSLAAGIDGGQVGVGAAEDFATPGEADVSALQSCSARVRNCGIVGRFSNGGCGYITTTPGRGTCYGYGATPEIASEECEARGCGPCQEPIGGCTRR